MLMRFNPPSNWPVPPGWSPGPGRRVDPSWPAPPPGWQFWVVDEQSSKVEEEWPGQGAASEPRGTEARRRVSRSMMHAGIVATVVALVALVGVAAWTFGTHSPTGAEPSSKPGEAPTPASVSVPTVLILDASGSMNQADAPGPRIDAAKTAARGLVDALPDDATVGLETYGMGTGSTESEHDAGCQDVQRVIALGPLNRDEMRAHVDGLNASGYTPIGLALDRAAAQLPADDSAQAIVLVSDGEDTCDSAPCDRASQIKHTHPQLVISTVGFKTDGPASDQLKCIAAATGGIFVQAANASQLAARLIATQDPGQAQTALTSNGIGDIELGANVADIRTKHSDFPDAGTTGRITVVWRDCDYDFTDGTLDAIRPRNGGRTIDGLTVGSPLSKATELYGGPLSTTPNSGGTTTVTYDADPNTDAAYQMVIDGYTSAGTNNPSNGTVETIVLCRCKPQSGPIAKPTALSPTSNNLVYIKAKSGDTWCMIMSSEVDCGARYTNPPELYGQPANGFRFRADGTSEWVVGNFGLVEWQQIDHATYTAIGWTVDSTASGLTFTNDDTGHSVFVSPGRVERVG